MLVLLLVPLSLCFNPPTLITAPPSTAAYGTHLFGLVSKWPSGEIIVPKLSSLGSVGAWHLFFVQF
jgi:hypothetical protein